MTSRQAHQNHHRSPFITAAVVAFLALVGCLGLTTAASASAAPYCGIVWGSLTKQGGIETAPTLAGVRTGRHECFDRLVLDLHHGASAGYDVSYVDAVYTDGEGAPVPLRGGAWLRVIVHASDYDQEYLPTYTPANPAELANVTGYQTFRQVAYAGSFEGQTMIGLGVRARLPFRVFILAGPGDGSRLVVDVAHLW
jgi:hypothetical protein